VPAGSVLVRGTVEAQGVEVGVTVNGSPTSVRGNDFVAVVPVDPDTTTLTALATTAAGATATNVIAITVSAAAETTALRVSPASGVAPLAVSFSLVGPAPSVAVELDADGDGRIDVTGSTLDDYTFTYARPGIYAPKVSVTDALGNRATATAIVQVFDLTGLDTLLQAKWSALRDALRRGDVDGAVTTFALSSRDAYRDQLAALASAGALGQVANDLGSVRLVRIMDQAAEFDLRAIRNATEYSFYVLFVVDVDGVWRLWAF
jgi:hypothetical protein